MEDNGWYERVREYSVHVGKALENFWEDEREIGRAGSLLSHGESGEVRKKTSSSRCGVIECGSKELVVINPQTVRPLGW